VQHRGSGALGTFPGHMRWFLLAPSPVMCTVTTTRTIPDWSPLLSFSLRSGAVVILTSAARSGGEVRITEAERPPTRLPWQEEVRGRAGIAADSAHLGGHDTVQPVCGVCRGYVRRPAARNGSARRPQHISQQSLLVARGALGIAT
jgi:hypothetical protein